MKILIIHNKYQSNNIGGEDIVFQNEFNFLQKKLGEENVLSYVVSNDDVNKFKLLFGIWSSSKYYKAIKKIVEDNNIDIVHVHNFFPLLTPSVFKASKDAGAKVIHTLHNYRFWCIAGIFYRDGIGVCELCTKKNFSIQGILNGCFRKSIVQSTLAQLSFWYFGATKAFDYIDHFFLLTNFQKEKVQALGIDKNKIILKPNSINANFEVKTEKEGYVYVGRLEESKGIYELLEIWKKLDEKYILTIVGGGDIEEELKEKYKKKNIIFKGKCSREETLKSISKSKYLIQPSICYESFGLTIIEAMSFGVPVIGFDIGTRKDFVEDSKNGFLSDGDNLKSVIEKSFYYKKYDEMSKNAKETGKLYENNYIIQKQIDIYKNILDKNENFSNNGCME